MIRFFYFQIDNRNQDMRKRAGINLTFAHIMVELFKTNIVHHFDAIKIKELLAKEFPRATFQFDLQNKDHLLRVEGTQVPVSRVVQILKYEGFYCEVVETKIEP